MKQKIIISINTAWNVHNYRSGLVKALLDRGYEVIALAPDDEYSARVRDLGCGFVHIPIDNNGTNPWRDLLLLARYFSSLLLGVLAAAAHSWGTANFLIAAGLLFNLSVWFERWWSRTARA